MKIPDQAARRGRRLDLAMTPMIDVVFLLLLYFVLTTSFREPEYEQQIQTAERQGSAPADPADPPPPEADFDDVVVRIEDAGGKPAWRINGEPVGGLAELRDRLAQIAAVRRDAPVILHPDKTIAVGDVMDGYDTAQLAGFEQVQFAASRE